MLSAVGFFGRGFDSHRLHQFPLLAPRSEDERPSCCFPHVQQIVDRANVVRSSDVFLHLSQKSSQLCRMVRLNAIGARFDCLLPRLLRIELTQSVNEDLSM